MEIDEIIKKFESIGINLGVDADEELTVDAPFHLLTSEVFQEINKHRSEIIHYFSNQSKTIPMTYDQQEIWTAEQLSSDSGSIYNLTSGFELKGALNVLHLKESIQELVNRHEALRTIPNDDGETQTILGNLLIDLPSIDYSKLSDEEKNIHRAAQIAVLGDLHDRIDRAVFDAQ